MDLSQTCIFILAIIFSCSAKPQVLKGTPSVIFLLDNSESIGSDVFNTMKMVLADEIKDIASNGIQVGVISFSSNSSIDADLQDWTGHTNTLHNIIINVPYVKKLTNMRLAIDTAISELGPSGPRVIVLFSDGVADNQDAARDAANKAKEDGILIYSVGIGKHMNLTKLNTLSYFPARNFTGLVAHGFPLIKDVITGYFKPGKECIN